MDFASGLSALATNAGYALQAQQHQAQQQAQLDDTRAQVQIRQMQALGMRQELDDRKNREADAKEGFAGLGEGVKSLEGQLKGYENTAAIAASKGHFDTARQMELLARGVQTELKGQREAAYQDLAIKNESAGKAALEYQDNPTPEAAQAVVQKALAAGIPKEQIPPATDAQAFGRFARSLPTRAMSVEKSVTLKQQEAKATEDRNARTEAQRAEHERKLERDRETAAARGDSLEIKRLLARSLIEAREGRGKNADGFRKTHPAQVESGIQMIVGSAGEAMQALENIADMNKGTTGSMFSELQNHNLSDALVRGGTQALTPERQKLYDTMLGGLSTEMVRVLTGGGGRGGTQAMADELRKVLRVEPTDSEGLAMFKLINGVGMLRNRLHFLDNSDSPKMKGLQAELEEKFKSYPTTKEFMAAVRKNPKLAAEFDLKSPSLLSAVQKATGMIRAADQDSLGKASAAPSGPPAGFTVDN